MIKFLKYLWCRIVGHHANGRRTGEGGPNGGIILHDPYCRRCGYDLDTFEENQQRVGRVS